MIFDPYFKATMKRVRTLQWELLLHRHAKSAADSEWALYEKLNLMALKCDDGTVPSYFERAEIN